MNIRICDALMVSVFTQGNTRTATPEQDRQPAACRADTGPARRGRAAAVLTPHTEANAMHMAPKNDRRSPPIGNTNVRRMKLVALILAAAGLLWTCKQFREINTQYAAASAVLECKQRAAAEGSDLSNCNPPEPAQ